MPLQAPLDLGSGRGPQWLDEYLATQLHHLVAMRRDVHAHPELSRTESATSALILRSLADAGINGTATADRNRRRGGYR